MILDSQVESRHNDAPRQNRTQPKRKKQVDGRLDPAQIEDFSAHVSHLSEHVRDGIIEGVEEPLHQVVPNGVDDGVADALKHTPPMDEAILLTKPSSQLNMGDHPFPFLVFFT